jgi:hypothetical protein
VHDFSPLARKLVARGAPKELRLPCLATHAGHLAAQRGRGRARLGAQPCGSDDNTSGYSHGYRFVLKCKLLTDGSKHVERVLGPEGAALLR